jgi:hypothetical protein
MERSLVMTDHSVTDQQLGVLARRQHDLFRRVREGSLPITKVLAGLQGLIEGRFDTTPSGGLIDCDATPYIPKGEIVEHQKNGQLEFDPSKIVLHLEPGQKTGAIVGYELRKALASKPVLNACVLDHLLINPNLIPENWKQDEQGRTQFICFWGTVYRYDGRLSVRFLYWNDRLWVQSSLWLDDAWGARRPAALLAS